METSVLQITWFVLLGILLCGYAILDGFDLGVGILHPWVAKGDEERRLVMNSIGPLWDGNEVWLVTFGGALFAAFPDAYGTVMESLYIAIYLLLVCLIGRAVSLEFRSKVHSPAWRRLWDGGFFLSSFTAAFLLGVAAGNVLRGMDIGPYYAYQGSLLQQLDWYPLLVGCLTASLFALHGAIYLYLKTEATLQERVRKAITWLFFLFAAHYVAVTAITLLVHPQVTDNMDRYPILWAVPVLNALAILNIPRAMHLRRPGYAFFSSVMVIVAFAGLFSVAIFPNLVVSRIDEAYNVTVATASSSEGTLWIMLMVAAIGMPCVLSYTAIVYWIFRGKVKLESHSY